MLDTDFERRRSWLVVAAGILGATAIGLGAFHAHGMDERLAAMGLDAETVAYRMELCGTGLKYHLAHAVALLVIGLVSQSRPQSLWRYAGAAMLVGTLLFSGSLYAIVVTGVGKYGMITPVGGVCLIIAWLMVMGCGFTRSSRA